MNLFIGSKVLAEKKSKYNKTIKVIKTLGLGIYIQVEGLTQSGGIVEGIWKSTLKKVSSIKYQVSNCLILGLGGGSAAKIVRKYWPHAKITGVDIDPVIVDLGKRYLGLDEIETGIVIEDANNFVRQEVKGKRHEYDLVLVDLYQGYDVPEKFQTDEFLRLIHKLLSDSGLAVFNRLYFNEKRTIAMKFGKKLEKTFKEVEYFYPEANIILICKR